MSFVIYKNSTREKLAKSLPKQYASRLPARLDASITAVVFTCVVTERILRKALARLEMGSETLLLAAPAFTTEALRESSSLKPLILSTGSDAVQWTDQSYEGAVSFRTAR